MSIRNSPQSTSPFLDAVRSNARRSHGPRSAAGKQNCKLNALRHGERSDPDNHYEVMRALGEDPARFEALRQELTGSFGSGDGLFAKQVDDLARLYWRRERLERMETGLMRRALQELDERQHARRQAIEGASFEPGQAINIDLVEPSDPAARQRLLRSFLGVIREQVRAGSFLAWQGASLKRLYRGKWGWRAARLGTLLKEFAARASQLAEEKARQERAGEEAAWLAGAALWAPAGPQGSLEELPGPGSETPTRAEPAPAPAEPGADPREELSHRELLALLEVEMAQAEREFEYEEQLNAQKDAIERDACLAPEGEQWKLLLRREETLDRAIDRKIKQLLTLRKTAARIDSAAHAESGAHAESAAPLESGPLSPGESDFWTPMGSIGPQKSGRVSGSGAVISRSVTGEGSLAHLDPGSECWEQTRAGADQSSARPPKIDERSGNVDENKGPLN